MQKNELLKGKKKASLAELMPVIREKLDMGGEVRLPATGMSMSPLFRHMRDTVVLKSSAGEQPKKYDMVLYQRDSGQYVLHRIVGYAGKGYILRGDAQYINESPVRADQVIAYVTRFTRNGREHDCKEWGYRLYAFIWVNTCFVRRVYSAVGRRAGRIIRNFHPGRKY